VRAVGPLWIVALLGCGDVAAPGRDTLEVASAPHEPAVHPSVAPPSSDGPVWIGAENCAACHTRIYHAWRGSAHAEEGVDCEHCHGPGSAHANNPRLLRSGLVRDVPRSTCADCHDDAADSDLDYARRRDALLASGHGLAEGHGRRAPSQLQ
jgi:hypothetical protein